MKYYTSLNYHSGSQPSGFAGTSFSLRSTALKTAKRPHLEYVLFAGLILLAVTLSPACLAIEVSTTDRAQAATTAGVNSPEAIQRRQQVAQLLKLARQAMERGQLQLAGNYLDRAESLNPQYDAVTVKFQDTPAKVRAELVQNGGAAGSAQITPQGNDFLPLRRVFGARPTASQFPPQDPYSIATEQASIDSLADQTRATAIANLQRGRAALAQGDLTAAVGWYHKSTASRVHFGPTEYGPAQLAEELMTRGVAAEQLVSRQQSVSVLQPTDVRPLAADRVVPLGGSTTLESANNTFRQGLVNDPGSLTSQLDIHHRRLHAARRALAAGDLRAASLQLSAAKSLNVAERPGNDTPRHVESLIAKAQQLAQLQATQGRQPQFQRQLALLLMAQADQLLEYRDFTTARWLAEKARALPVRYQALDPTPAGLLAKITARQQGTTLSVSSQQPPLQARNRIETVRLLALGKTAMDRGDIVTAYRLLEQAESLKVPDSAFGNRDMRPWQLRLQLENRDRLSGNTARLASYSNDEQSSPTGDNQFPVRQGDYNPAADGSRTVAATTTGQAITAQDLYQQGLRALAGQERDIALARFKAALAVASNAVLERQIREKISLLIANDGIQVSPRSARSPLEEITVQQRLLRQKLFTEIAAEQKSVEEMTSEDPKGALERLIRLRERVETGEDVDDSSRKRMLAIVDRSISSMEAYINANAADIELDAKNKAVLEQIRARRDSVSEMREQLASMVDEFNSLIDERRFAEAEVIAKQAREIAPDEPVVQTLIWKSKFMKAQNNQLASQRRKEQGFLDELQGVEDASASYYPGQPYHFDNAREWRDLTISRRRGLKRESSHLSPAGLKIQRALNQPVDVSFTDTPLSAVTETLGEMAGINVHLDSQGLGAEGVTSSTLVSINLSQPVTLKSAQNLILAPLRLSYIIRNEVLLITSEMSRDTNVYQEVYNVADLVTPIPDFYTGPNVGLPSAIRDAHETMVFAGGRVNGDNSSLSVAGGLAQSGGLGDNSLLAQLATSNTLSGAHGAMPITVSGGQGGAAMADFDSLIELITTTIEKDSWEDVGGAGTIKEFRGNLSLVISQTQQVHEQIRDLLDQLRRLQDLQITIEVRFITLQDNFYERIGIDFDFEIDDNVDVTSIQDDSGPSVMFGIDSQGPTPDLDLVFDQGDAFNAAVPAFGGFDAGSAMNFGFAILSDIEVFLLLQAAIGDTRSNVLTAPKVTLFNGQQASISDTSQRPFVTGVIPVVGDFAVGHQPVIVVLSEGTNLSVRAVCSNDRRFVRLTLVPFFSRIGEVEQFTFNGEQTTSTGETVLDPDGNPQSRNNVVTTNSGTTVQLPTFQFTTVSTTVSVPDGGTVLLGGIKRLAEGRTERGVPMLAQLPYINRLFKNVGIGRDTQSLMMMVTPRIIIQEEEELAQTGLDSSQL